MQLFSWKIILSIILFISFIFFSLSAVESLQNKDIPDWTGKACPEERQPPFPPVKEVRFYPTLPPKLPDLSEGYLFNQERKIQQSVETTEDIPKEDSTYIDVEEVRYAGSLIVGNMRKGLIRYQAAATPVNNRRNRVTVRGRQQATNTAKWSSKVVEEGEKLSGYEVVSISAQSIVFEQGGKQIEKELYSPDKDRVAFTPPMNSAKPAQKKVFRKTNRTYKPGTKVRTTSTSSRVRTPEPSRNIPGK